MANLFWGGFADSLAGNLKQRADSDLARQDWEWKARKTKELEDEIASTRKVSSRVFKKGNEYYVQAYNAAGEPVGQPVMATQGRIDEYEQGIEERALEFRKQEAAAKRDETATRQTEQEMGFAPERERREAEQAASNIRYQGALGAESSARTRATNENIRRDKFINDAIEKDPSLAASLASGSRKGSAPKEVDVAKIMKDLESFISEDELDDVQMDIQALLEVNPHMTATQIKNAIMAKRAQEIPEEETSESEEVRGPSLEQMLRNFRLR